MRFTKMHGLGNDFMVINGINQSVNLNAAKIAKLADRHRGIGFDQCLLVENSDEPGIDFKYRIFNADGHEVGQCGNGARCLARFLRHYGLTSKTTINVATATRKMTLIINNDGSVSVDMGQPIFDSAHIPLLLKPKPDASFVLETGTRNLKFHAVNVGNPHAVIYVDDLESESVSTLGKQLSEHPVFPEQANVGFMQIVSKNQIKLRVYERGCGETQACGSGAVAAAVVARRYYDLSNPVTVSLPGGDLMVSWAQSSEPVILTGPAVFVYEGTVMTCE